MSEDQQVIRRQFQWRFAFGLNAVVLFIISLMSFFLALTHPLNMTLLNGQAAWAGYARPDLMYVGSMLLGVVGLHGIWLLGREGKLKPRGLRFALHLLGIIVSVMLTMTFFNSWYFNEAHKWIAGYTPVSPGAPSEIIVVVLLLLTAILTLTLPLHGIFLVYKTLLTRTLQRSSPKQRKYKRKDVMEAKLKRDEARSLAGDDHELSEWGEQAGRAKRLS